MPRLRFPTLAVPVLVLVAAPGLVSPAPPDPAALRPGPADDDPVAWLREYVQIDTTNPPGPGEEATAFLESLLSRSELEVRRLVHPDGPTSLWARLPATAPPGGEALVLVHHVDVVPAEGRWRHPPFSGRLDDDGKVWGRGALDVKSLGIAQIAAVLELAGSGAPRGRDVVLLATPDEETGGEKGAAWLLAEHPELFSDVGGVLNEGGSNRVVGHRLLWWGLEVTQKRPLWLRVSAEGRGGHASGHQPRSATHRLVLALARLVERPDVWKVEDSTRRYLEALARLEGNERGLASRLDEVIRPDGPTEALPPGMSTYFVDTVQVTRIDNGVGTNVIAPLARAWVDVRLLPSTDTDAFVAGIAETLGPDVGLEVLLRTPPAPPSPLDSRLYRTLEQVLGVRGPVVPSPLAGATDSRWFRQRGIPAYGFSPFTIDAGDLRGIHAEDEAIPEVDLRRGIGVLRRILEAWVDPEAPATRSEPSDGGE